MTLWMENHDQPPGISTFATSDPRFRAIRAKFLAVYLFNLRGTPFIYHGQESGVINPSEFNERDELGHRHHHVLERVSFTQQTPIIFS
jgi:glycosidase